MDVTLLSENSIKIKGKKAAFIVDPEKGMQKNNADAIILLKKDSPDLTRVDDYRVIIDGPGEYEVGRVKISGIKSGEDTVYSLIVDNVEVLLGKVSALANIADKIQEHKVAILDVDLEIKESVITAVEPRLAILYGEKASEGAKTLGKDESSIQRAKKISFNEDKLPEEMGVAVLS